MHEYLRALSYVYNNGEEREDRTGVGTRSVFGLHMKFDLSKGFPLVTTRRIYTKGVIHELLWFLKGDTNTRYLTDNGVNFWEPWADENGDLGPVYGKQWVTWECPDGSTIDQISNVIESIKNNPYSRRYIVTTWNPADIDKMALPPCHGNIIQFYVSNDNKLSTKMYQRSADMPVGIPFNIASYALLTHMVAQVTGLKVGHLHMTIGDAHIYLNQLEAVERQIMRIPLSSPKLKLNKKIKNIFDFTYDDIKIEGYNHMGDIKMEVAV